MLELVISLTQEQLAEQQRLEEHTYFDCEKCKKQAWTTVRFTEKHKQYCPG